MGNVINEEFKLYMDYCHPGGVGLTQWREIKQAFYAGAYVMFSKMLTISENYTEEQAMEYIDQLREELEKFHIKNAKGEK